MLSFSWCWFHTYAGSPMLWHCVHVPCFTVLATPVCMCDGATPARHPLAKSPWHTAHRAFPSVRDAEFAAVLHSRPQLPTSPAPLWHPVPYPPEDGAHRLWFTVVAWVKPTDATTATPFVAAPVYVESNVPFTWFAAIAFPFAPWHDTQSARVPWNPAEND